MWLLLVPVLTCTQYVSTDAPRIMRVRAHSCVHGGRKVMRAHAQLSGDLPGCPPAAGLERDCQDAHAQD
eukprot:COSAG05_NODE_1347_length_5118_cov_5.195258_3_plen_69_part_00